MLMLRYLAYSLCSLFLTLTPVLEARESDNATLSSVFQPDLNELRAIILPTHFILSGYLRKSMTVRIYPKVMSHFGIEGQFLPYELPLREGKIDREKLTSFIDVFRTNASLQSLIVSDPYKQVVVEYLDEMTDSASAIKTVNLIYKMDGKLVGDNLEARGFLLGAQEELNFEYEGHSMLFFGCGGVSSGIACALAQKLTKVGLIDIDKEKRDKLASVLKNLYPSVSVVVFDRDSPSDFSDFDIFYNGTGLGKFSSNPESILLSPILEGDIFPKAGLAIDANYTPWKTLFLQQMNDRGLKTLNGFSHMLSATALHLSKISGKEITYTELKRIQPSPE